MNPSPPSLAKGQSVLEVRDLSAHFDTLLGPVRSVDGISLTVRAGETLGVVGESGCGKSVTAMSIMRLLPANSAHVFGSVTLRGTELLALSERQMRAVRGNRISMVFQEPMTSLNPVLTIGRQIAESIALHQDCSASEAHKRSVAMLRMVQIPEPERRAKEYPHQLSGGMRQRVMIALALACNPEVLIADEPTTALDVTIQAQILDLIARLRADLGMGVVMITHDLGVVAESCDHVIVMYAGKIVEEAPVLELFADPKHPYTRALMASMPAMNVHQDRLAEIPGLVPSAHEIRRGCTFAARCTFANSRCRVEVPRLRPPEQDKETESGHLVACFGIEEHRIPRFSSPDRAGGPK
jgi:peptide/nickel transport system ATP-binding protein